MSAYRFDIVGAEAATAFWRDSPHATAYTNPDVLGRLTSAVDWWVACRGREPLCLWPVCRTADNTVRPPVLSYYVGPLWSAAAMAMPVHRWLAVTSAVYGGLVERLIDNYGCIRASLPIGVDDVRMFDWWNYGKPHAPHFRIRVRYTARIDNLGNATQDTLLANFRTLRRRECRYIGHAPPDRGDPCTAEDLIALYCGVLHTTDDALSPHVRRELETLLALTADGLGDAVIFRDPVSGRAVSVALLLYGNQVANLVVNAVTPSWRNTGLPAWTMLHALLTARDRGMTAFDFNGANSPRRGDDKHSYGARPALFFDLEYPCLLMETDRTGAE